MRSQLNTANRRRLRAERLETRNLLAIDAIELSLCDQNDRSEVATEHCESDGSGEVIGSIDAPPSRSLMSRIEGADTELTVIDSDSSRALGAVADEVFTSIGTDRQQPIAATQALGDTSVPQVAVKDLQVVKLQEIAPQFLAPSFQESINSNLAISTLPMSTTATNEDSLIAAGVTKNIPSQTNDSWLSEFGFRTTIEAADSLALNTPSRQSTYINLDRFYRDEFQPVDGQLPSTSPITLDYITVRSNSAYETTDLALRHWALDLNILDDDVLGNSEETDAIPSLVMYRDLIAPTVTMLILVGVATRSRKPQDNQPEVLWHAR